MWKKLISLNLALLLLVTLLPAGTVTALAYEGDGEEGYAIYYKNDGTEESVSQNLSTFLSSNASLQLYTVMPNFSCDGKVLTSFNSKANGTGTEYPLSGTLRDSWSTDSAAPGRLYAQWTDTTEPYVFYLDISPLEQGKETWALDNGLTSPATLRDEDTFTKADTHVIGWADSTEKWERHVYRPGEEIAVSGGVKLYSIMGVNYVTYHYLGEEWGSPGFQPIAKTEYYSVNDAESDEIHYEKDTNDKMFLGWNSSENGEGTWFTNEPVQDRPHDLYAQYEAYPQTDYCILSCSIGLESGRENDFLLTNSGKATLPSTLNGGKKAAYWYDESGSTGSKYYPCNQEVAINSGAKLWPAVIYDGEYYGVIDGNGGVTPANSAYSAGSCLVTSSGDLSLYYFSDMDTFVKDEEAVSGYEGRKTGTMYDIGDDVWAAMKAETESDRIARFTAQYESVSGDYIHYIGNGGETPEGKSSYVQDGLNFSAPGSASFAENQFAPPGDKNFIGWNTQPSGQGTWYNPGDGIDVSDVPSNLMLYAQWGVNRITYHYYSSHDGWSAETKLDEEIIAPPRSREGYRADRKIEQKAEESQLFSYLNADDALLFEGWNTALDQQGTWYCTYDEVPAGTVIDLYESWVFPPSEGFYYTLSARKLANGRMVEFVPMSKAEETITLPSGQYGWYNRETAHFKSTGFLDEEADVHGPGESYEITSGTHLTAFCPLFSVEYHGNYEGYDGCRIQYGNSSSAGLTLYNPAKVFGNVPDGKIFTGWNTQADGSGETHWNGTTFWWDIKPLALPLYAQWQSPPSPPDPDPGPGPGPAPDPGPDVEPDPEPTPEEPVVTTQTDPDGTVTTTTTWPDGKMAVSIKTPEGGQTITATTPEGEMLAEITIPDEPGPAKEFQDVQEGDWYKKAVDSVTGLGLFSGTGATDFSPNAPLTRGMLATVLHRLSGEVKYGEGTNAFPDVEEGRWYENAVDWASATGVTTGSDDGFHPDGSITREQLVTMLYRYAGLIGAASGKEADLQPFPDNSDISAYATAAMKWAVAEGLIQGKGGRIEPRGNATRAEVATVLTRFVEYLSR